MRSWAALLLLLLPSVFLIWSGANLVRRRRAPFGRGYRTWTGRKAVALGYCWAILGIALFVLGAALLLT